MAVCSGFRDQKIGYREEDVLHWFQMVAGTGRRPEMEDSQKWKNDGVGRRWSCFQILIFFFFLEKKITIKLKWPFPRRKGPGRGQQDGPRLLLLVRLTC